MAGAAKKVCRPHSTGVAPGTPKFFNPDCTECQKNLAAGKVTGKEGPLPKNWRRTWHANTGFQKSKIIVPFRRS